MYTTQKQTLPETIKVQSDNGSLRLQFSTDYNPIFGKRKHQGLGLKDTPENWQKAIAIAYRIEADLQHPDWQTLFDPTFAKYGLKTKYAAELKLAAPIPEPVPEITVGAMWEAYLEWKKTVIEETTFKVRFAGVFSYALKGLVWDKLTRKHSRVNVDVTMLRCDEKIAIKAGIDSMAISLKSHFISELYNAFEFGKSKGLVVNSSTGNPFDTGKFNTPVQTTQQKYAPKMLDSKQVEWHEIEDEKSLEEDRRAFTKDERDIIIKAFYESSRPTTRELAALVEFLFLTGCRPSESLSLTWKDVDFERNIIRFSKSLGVSTRKVKETKTGEIRLFYFGENCRLKTLLLEIKANSKNGLIFPNTKGGYVRSKTINECWNDRRDTKVSKNGTEKIYLYPGVVSELVRTGAISGYLSPYHTRHTYITLTAQANAHNNNALLHIASACGNSVDVILRHYLGVDESVEVLEA